MAHEIDQWVIREPPRPHAAATLHTETVGMVVDRIARFSVDAHCTLDTAASEAHLHYAW
ncbi:conserved hypothetical protein [Nocardia seriolae]|nr:conserved hypothetical protein [Nocardia seriolae]